MAKRTVSSGLGSLGRGAITAVALAVQTGLAAIVGVIVARHFGRTAQTDGFFAAYGVFAVLVLAATAIRVTILPTLARARAEQRLGSEVVSYTLAVGLVVTPLLVASFAAARPVAALLTGFGPQGARHAAAEALPWMVLAAVCQLFAGFAASALAALDDYVIAAGGFALGSVAGLALILLRVDPDGIRAVSWGMALNGAISLAVPVTALALKARREQMPYLAVRPGGRSHLPRLGELAVGVAFPLAMQSIYLICLPLASRQGVGSVTSFSYAYLIGSAVVAVTASSLGLVTSVPLSRVGVEPAGVARHVVASSWIALLTVGAVAGVFAAAGERIAGVVLGSGYESHVGSQLSRLVVVLAPWMAITVGFSVTFPVLFAAGYVRRLPRLTLVAVVLVAVHPLLAIGLRSAAGLDGLAASLAVTTAVALAAMLVGLRAAFSTVRGLAVATLTVALLAAIAFAPLRFVLGPVASAALGIGLYGVLVATIRPRGLRSAWRYLRALS